MVTVFLSFVGILIAYLIWGEGRFDKEFYDVLEILLIMFIISVLIFLNNF